MTSLRNEKSAHSFGQLKRCFEELNSLYSDSLRILQDCRKRGSSLACLERLAPKVSAIQQLEKDAGLSKPAIQELINSSERLSRLAADQKPLLEELLTQVVQVQSEFQVRRSTISHELDQQSEHEKMRVAYDHQR